MWILGPHFLHCKHFMKGSFKGHYHQEEWLQRAKPLSLFIQASDYCFKTDLKKLWTYPLTLFFAYVVLERKWHFYFFFQKENPLRTLCSLVLEKLATVTVYKYVVKKNNSSAHSGHKNMQLIFSYNEHSSMLIIYQNP